MPQVKTEVRKQVSSTWFGGGQSVTVQLVGTGFSPNAVVRFDNSDLPTRFVSGTTLTATIDARLLRNLGTYAVYAVNPGVSGSVSNSLSFLVNFRD